MQAHSAILILPALLLAGAAHAQDGPEDANATLARLAGAARAAAAADYQTFRDSVLYLPETGKFYASGDVPIRNEKLLREFWEQNIRDDQIIVPPLGEGGHGIATPGRGGIPEFTIGQNGGLDQIWSAQDQHALTYCVSTDFGSRHALVTAAMENAAAAWEAVADLDFAYLPAEDADCSALNSRVMFDVTPVDTRGDLYAAAFFPNDPRPARRVVIDPISFALDPNGNLTLDGILRHELGHVIGARHEHIRPEAGICFEDGEWRGVTDYDAFSVMHYPQCAADGGADRDWSFRLTRSDMNGAACIYGPAPGFTIDSALCTPTGGARPAATVQHFGPHDIAAGETQMIATLPVAPGTPFSAEMTGEGDPDLYVKFDGQALPTNYDCRPYQDGAAESCTHPVPEGRSLVSIAVHGYAAGRFALTVTSTPPDDQAGP